MSRVRARPRAEQSLAWLLFPLCCCVLVVLLWRPDDKQADAGAATSTRKDAGERVIVVVIDSMRRTNLEEPGHMDRLHELARRPGSIVRDVTSCAANFTLPCMQTMMEGRQSPFSTGLHNVTGTSGGSSNVIAVARQHGLGGAIMSDPTLSSLYGRFAARSFDLDTMPQAIEARDVASLAIAAQWLEEPELRLQLIHVIGTDYVAHYKRAGSEGYRKHFHDVDAALALLVERMDPARDHLLVLGDHGHDDTGSHSRETLFVAVGPRYRELGALTELPPVLDQTEIAWLVAYPLGLPVPAGYEGRQFLDEPLARGADDGHAARFVALQRASLGVGADVPLAREVERRLAEAVAEDWLLFARIAPLLLAYLAWIVLAFRPDPFARRLRPLASVAAGAYALAAAWAVSLGGAAIALGLSLPPLIALVLVARRLRAARIAAFAAAALALAGALGFLARPWGIALHNSGGLPPQVWLFYGGMPVAGWLLARLLCRRGHWRALPETTLVVGAVCLPSGIYYYQGGQNLLWGFFLGLLLWGVADAFGRREALARLRAQPRWRIVAAIGFVPIAAALVAQEAGGWLYFHYVGDKLAQLGALPTAAAYTAVAACSVLLMPTRRSQLALALVATAGPIYASGLAQLPLSYYAVAALVTLLFVLGLYAPGDGASFRHRRYGFLLGAGALAAVFIEVRGFFVQRMDYGFALAWAADMKRLRDVAFVVVPGTALKYGFAIIVLVVAARGLAGRRRFVRIAWSALVLGNLKVAALLLQSVTGRLDRIQKLHELAMNETVFVVLIVAIVGVLAVAIQAVDRFIPSAAPRRTQPTSPAPLAPT